MATCSGGSSSAFIWDLETGNELQQLNAGGYLYSVVFSPDGKTLATGAEDDPIRIWDVETGKELSFIMP